MRKTLNIFIFLLVSVNIYGKKDTFIVTTQETQIPISKDHTLLKDTIWHKQIDSDKSSDEFDYKTWLPTGTALFVLLITNLVTLYKIRKDTREAIKKDIIITKIRIDRDRLEKFYDPIYTTLRSNTSIFNAYGPDSFPRDSGVMETEASQVWSQLVENVVIPNNQKIKSVIQQFSHLKNDTDNLESYLEYLVHLESYEHFIKNPNTIHKAFRYPTTFIANVEANRNKIIASLKVTEKKLSE